MALPFFGTATAGALSAVERSYPTSEVRGNSLEEPPCVQGQGWGPGGATPCTRPGTVVVGATPCPRPGVAAEMSYPTSKVGVAAKRSNPMSKEWWLHGHRRAERT